VNRREQTPSTVSQSNQQYNNMIYMGWNKYEWYEWDDH